MPRGLRRADQTPWRAVIGVRVVRALAGVVCHRLVQVAFPNHLVAFGISGGGIPLRVITAVRGPCRRSHIDKRAGGAFEAGTEQSSEFARGLFDPAA